MLELNYTDQGRRPSTPQIVSDWKKANRPDEFTVEYGETYAHFTWHPGWKWQDDGNGCRGVNRLKVVNALNSLMVRP